MKLFEFNKSIVEMLIKDCSGDIVNDFTLEDFNQVKKAHELGNIKFIIYLDLSPIHSDELIIRIGDEFQYFIIDNSELYYKELLDIVNFYKKFHFMDNLIEYKLNDINHLRYVEVCDEYITFLDKSDLLLFCPSDCKYYKYYLEQYNLMIMLNE